MVDISDVNDIIKVNSMKIKIKRNESTLMAWINSIAGRERAMTLIWMLLKESRDKGPVRYLWVHATLPIHSSNSRVLERGGGGKGGRGEGLGTFITHNTRLSNPHTQHHFYHGTWLFKLDISCWPFFRFCLPRSISIFIAISISLSLVLSFTHTHTHTYTHTYTHTHTLSLSPSLSVKK